MTGSIYFTMVITVERYLTVCHPFYMLSREWSSRKIVAGISAFAIAYNIPKFLEIGTGYTPCTLTEEYITQNMTNQLMLSSETNCSGKTTQTLTNATTIDNSILLNEPVVSSFTKYHIQPTEMRLNSLYVQVYAVYFNFFVNGVGPFTLLIILNLLILKQLQESIPISSPKRKSTHGKYSQNTI